MKVNICGILYKVIKCKDNFDVDAHFGQIDYKQATIRINADMSESVQKEALYHEIVHGMLVHIGHGDKSEDEQFVQALGNAIYQTFELKGEGE